MESAGLIHNIIFFVIAIGVLVAFHEFGHYWVARLCNVKVIRFSIGFGKPLLMWKRQKGDDLIEFVVAAIPLGGFVKMLDEREAPVDDELRHRAFNTQPVSKRIAIVAAGPIFNFILAVFFYFIFFVNGEEGIRPVVAQPAADTPAYVAGFEVEDEVVKVGNTQVNTWNDFRIALIDQGIDGGEVEVTVRQQGLYELRRQVVIGDMHILNEKDDITELLGFKLWRPQIPSVIGGTTDDGAAKKAGLQKGDRVVAIDDRPLNSWDELVEIIQASADRKLQFSVDRGSEQLIMDITPTGKKRGEQTVGFLGAYPEVPSELIEQTRTVVEYTPFEAVTRAMNETWTFSVLTLKVLGKMLIGQAALENISGPITIAQYAGITASISILMYIKFLAMISVSLGVLNLLPVPMLDGGHLLYYLIEIIKGSPVSQKFEEMGQQVGLTLLFLLMSLAIFNDIQRLIN